MKVYKKYLTMDMSLSFSLYKFILFLLLNHISNLHIRFQIGLKPEANF